ncbi:helix-turn-helix protein [Hungatella effluvii]|uniref:Stage 0 sporulation protein A homolog n=1 Tax=Hungatella effluvii TaxID=1096246 RepID=A0A2V3Y0X3_9FIRM|nr:response regulator [Hungatella effluvii]PXX51531.1 helix-turn-helix protein [Hungatella effluvii]
MYRVVIIDDEPIIVEGISKVVPWADYGCEVTATACSGLEGLEIIRKLRPDIIFTDISMPGMDGLSMIAALRVEFPEMMIAILTGYRDFDYAQKAIRLGVNRFLLKPSNMDEIKEALQFMADTLNKRKEQENALKTQNTAEVPVSPAAEPEGAAEQESSGNEDSSEHNSSEHNAGSFIVKTALKYMEENYTQKITLAEVAEKTYVSQWHLSKLLNGHTGKSFSELLNHIRIDEAKKLLKDPSLRIGDISEEVGFMDVAHFSKVFKKLEGISANEYRNSRI